MIGNNMDASVGVPRQREWGGGRRMKFSTDRILRRLNPQRKAVKPIVSAHFRRPPSRAAGCS